MPDELTKSIIECYRQATQQQQHARRAWLPSNRRHHSEMAKRWLALAQSYQLRLDMKRVLGESPPQTQGCVEPEPA